MLTKSTHFLLNDWPFFFRYLMRWTNTKVKKKNYSQSKTNVFLFTVVGFENIIVEISIWIAENYSNDQNSGNQRDKNKNHFIEWNRLNKKNVHLQWNYVQMYIFGLRYQKLTYGVGEPSNNMSMGLISTSLK